MGATRRKFTLEFKTEAAHGEIDTGRSVGEVAAEPRPVSGTWRERCFIPTGAASSHIARSWTAARPSGWSAPWGTDLMPRPCQRGELLVLRPAPLRHPRRAPSRDHPLHRLLQPPASLRQGRQPQPHPLRVNVGPQATSLMNRVHYSWATSDPGVQYGDTRSAMRSHSSSLMSPLVVRHVWATATE